VRHDYDVEISGGAAAEHDVCDYREVEGIRVAAKCRMVARTRDGQSLAEPRTVSVDPSEISFT
jgi:hypothetical protein